MGELERGEEELTGEVVGYEEGDDHVYHADDGDYAHAGCRE